MKKQISYDLVIGNALITTKKNEMTKEQIYKYWEIVDMLLPDNYYTYGDSYSFDSFCEGYNFVIKKSDNTIMINCDTNIFKRYFRIGIPTELAIVFDKAGERLNELESQKFDVLASPCKKEFIVSPEKTKEFKNIKLNPEVIEQMKQATEKLETNNLNDKSLILSKTKSFNKK